MLSIVFWNANGLERASLISRMARFAASDIIIIAEQGDHPASILRALNVDAADYSYAPGIGNTKLNMYVRFQDTSVTPVYETDRLSIRRVCLPDLPEFLLAAVHFPSKYAWNDASQTAEASVLAGDIRAAEQVAGHERTVLVGDLNMNPFEDGMVGATGLHGVMTKALAAKGERTVQGRSYPYFYNPMWGFLGDQSSGASGTFFHARSEHRVFFWNAFDQVLVRPSMIGHFVSSSLSVLTEIDGVSLLTAAGVPDVGVGSDHLPLTFSLQ